MGLISFQFALFFLIILPVNWMLRSRRLPYRLFLLAASYFFYGSFQLWFLLLLVNFSFFTWLLPLLMARTQHGGVRRGLIILQVCIGLAGLAFFKYYDFIYQSADFLLVSMGLQNQLPQWDIFLPIGISFFTFQGLSYGIDVYRDSKAVVKSPLDIFIFVAFFPTILSGPILRTSQLIPQLDHGELDREKSARGFFLILSGLFKKLFLATYLAEHLVQHAFEFPDGFSSWAVLCATFGYSIQILADFSGYTDLVMGVALLLGFSIPDNFDRPYRSTSLQEFWRRWHISFSFWLRDYLYISLGGSRVGKFRKYCNLFVTMALGGLWHGAGYNFLFWGIIHGLGLIVVHGFRDLKKSLFGTPASAGSASFGGLLTKSGSWLLTFLFVTFAWVFFGAEDFSRAVEILQRIAAMDPEGEGVRFLVYIIIAGVLLKEVLSFDIEKFYVSRVKNLPVPLQALLVGLICAIIIRLGPDGVPSFIYYRF